MIHSSVPTLATLGEFGLISRIASVAGSGAGVITGIGDDAAVTTLTPGMQLLTSTDMLLEDVHFRLTWHDPYRLGRKSLAVSISDIAAMGGIPRWALLSLGLPTDIPLDFIEEFMRGFVGLAAEYQVVLIGGDTCTSRSGVTISVTIMGEQFPDRIVRRSGARSGDDIWVTGTLGDAALALIFIEGGLDSCQPRTSVPSPPAVLLSRLLDPTPRVSTGEALAEAGLITAMIDVSDGVLADFGHIAEQSNVGGCIHLENLPLSSEFRAAVAHGSPVPLHLALSGGEDYELCFTAHPSCREKIDRIVKKCGITATRIGIVTSFPGVTAVTPDGAPFQTQTVGFNHFT